MFTMRVPTAARSKPGRLASRSTPEKAVHERPNAGLLEDELLDLYAAILIAVPVAFFLKWLWL